MFLVSKSVELELQIGVEPTQAPLEGGGKAMLLLLHMRVCVCLLRFFCACACVLVCS